MASITNKFSNTEQAVGGLAARVAALEAGVASASSGSDNLTAPQPLGLLGPVARGLLTTAGTQDADLIHSLIQMMNMHEVPCCFVFPCEQYYAGVSIWLEKFWATTNGSAVSKPTRVDKISMNFYAKHFLLVPAHNARSQVLSILDRRYGVGKPVSKLAPPG